MTPMRPHTAESVRTPLHEGDSTVPSVAATGRYFFADGKHEVPHTIDAITSADRKRELDWLEYRVDSIAAGTYDRLVRHFREWEPEISELLKSEHINVHNATHMQRVAGTAMAMGRAFGVPDHELEAAGLGARFHDYGYHLSAARRKAENVVLEKGKKEAFDDHAQLGADLFAQTQEDPRFEPFFRSWTDEQRKIAYAAIKYHNNGSAQEYEAHRSQIPLAAKLVSLADKIDNTRLRIFNKHLNPEVLDQDPRPEHRRVPSTIADYTLFIDHDDHQLTLMHTVHRQNLEVSLKRPYCADELIEDFRKAYGRSSMNRVVSVMEDAFRWPVEDGAEPVRVVAGFQFIDRPDHTRSIAFSSQGDVPPHLKVVA